MKCQPEDLRQLGHPGEPFSNLQDRKFSEKCWTHDLEGLLALANLAPTLAADTAANPALSANSAVAKDWAETSRSVQKTQPEAETLSEAITNDPSGVLPWIRIRW
jgi:hypothetical protein